MSFWSDLSPVVKGAIVVGVIGALVGILMLTGVIGGSGEPTAPVRGVSAPS